MIRIINNTFQKTQTTVLQDNTHYNESNKKNSYII